MSIQFHPEAETEFLAAIDWYEERSKSLGADFAASRNTGVSANSRR
jgi:hypothetical protein